MKKLSKIMMVMVLMFPMFLTNVHAEEPEERAVIYCERYKGKHRAVNQGPCNMYDFNNKSLSMYTWGYYKCACGSVVFCSGRPDSDAKAGIPEYYIETDVSKQGVDWQIYPQAFGAIVKTNLDIHYKNTPMISYTFVSA